MGEGSHIEGWHRDRRLAEVLDETDVLHVAVSARDGPRVTPTVFDVDRGRIWFVIPRRSVKARVIARRGRVGGLIQSGGRAVLIGGRARIVDPITARGVNSPDRLLDLPFAAAGYLGRNHRHATGTILGHAAPTLALSRVMVSIEVRRLSLLEGWSVVDTWGRWDRSDLLLRGDPTPSAPDLSAPPPGLRTLLANDAPVALGWQAPSGPLALPARWRATGELETSGEAMILAAAGSDSPACISAECSGHRLNSKQGVLLTGDGHARLDGRSARITLDTRRTTWWAGEEHHTIGAGGT
jgi:hypothetical protein